MVKPAAILQRLFDGHRTITFRDLDRVLVALGFTHARTNGSHRIYVHPGVPRPFPVQPDGKEAKRYQIRELLELMETYGLHIAE